MLKLVHSLTAAGLLCLSLPALAGEDAPDASEWQFELGGGAFYSPDYEGSDDYEVMAYPLIEVSWRDRLMLTTKGGPAIIGVPYVQGDFSTQLGLRYEPGRKQSDNDALGGLGDMDVGAVAFAGVEYEFGPVDAGLEMAGDLSGDRDGLSVTAELDYGLPLFGGKGRISFTPNLTWASGNYMQNTFGINATQAANSARGFSTFDADAGFKDAGLDIGLGYQITEHVTAIGRIGYSRLLGDAADSPLVKTEGSANQFNAGLGLTYRW